MMTFNRIVACEKMIQTLARIRLPNEHDGDPDPITLAIDDADALYRLVEEARDIMSKVKSTKGLFDDSDAAVLQRIKAMPESSQPKLDD